MSPEKMIELVMSGKETDFSQELASAFFNGYPIENLKPLLISTDPEILALGSYLIYELGEKARCLLEYIVPLMKDVDPQPRGDAVNALRKCATKFDTVALGKILELLDDPDPFVHRIVMRFIQCCDYSLLHAGVSEAAANNPNTVFEDLPRLLNRFRFRYKHSPEPTDLLELLFKHKSPIAKRFGVGLATRPRPIVDENLLDLADQIEEEECCEADAERSLSDLC